MDRHRHHVKLGCDLGDHLGQIYILTLHLVDVGDPGQFSLVGMVPHLLGAHLYAANRIEHDHRCVGDADTTDDLPDKVHVAGSVDHIQLVALPLARNQRGIDRHIAAAFLVVPVRDRRAVVDTAQAVDRPRVEKHRLDQRGLARATVAQEHRVAQLVTLEYRHPTSSVISSCP